MVSWGYQTLRNLNTQTKSAVTDAYAGGLIGLDQINAHIPHSLIGRGEVNVVVLVDGQAANALRVAIR
jgi:uncharacterized protein (TIGR03437 family)